MQWKQADTKSVTLCTRNMEKTVFQLVDGTDTQFELYV